MAKLYSRYISGTQTLAGLIAGSTMGESGLNILVDRLNSISDNDNRITSTIISGTETTIFTSGINQTYLIIENRTDDPSAELGRIWFRTDL